MNVTLPAGCMLAAIVGSPFGAVGFYPFEEVRSLWLAGMVLWFVIWSLMAGLAWIIERLG